VANCVGVYKTALVVSWVSEPLVMGSGNGDHCAQYVLASRGWPNIQLNSFGT
jgi:hypothetical protein